MIRRSTGGAVLLLAALYVLVAYRQVWKPAPSISEMKVFSDKDIMSCQGAVVLGMHRSGTSMLTGLMHEGFGYNLGKPLMEANDYNSKGYYELLPLVAQDDAWRNKYGVKMYTHLDVYKASLPQPLGPNGDFVMQFVQGNAPYLLKDPRLCVTLPTWLPHFQAPPAVLFTYRDPYDVAASLSRRELSWKDKLATKYLRGWIEHNELALQHSRGLCTVVTSNRALQENPVEELERIRDDLHHLCGVPLPPHALKRHVVDEFIDPNLQQSRVRNETMLTTYDDGKCKVYNITATDAKQLQVYQRAMKLYCDLESRLAFAQHALVSG